MFTHLNPLDASALRQIPTEPKNALCKQYIELFKWTALTSNLTPQGYHMVEKAVEFKLGACTQHHAEVVLNDAMLELPGTEEKELTVTRTFAEKHFTDNQQSGLRVA